MTTFNFNYVKHIFLIIIFKINKFVLVCNCINNYVINSNSVIHLQKLLNSDIFNFSYKKHFK